MFINQPDVTKNNIANIALVRLHSKIHALQQAYNAYIYSVLGFFNLQKAHASAVATTCSPIVLLFLDMA